ncbi:AAA family ATPase [Runella slithyformis]|uniref:SMC domain protein n=1 Tax=Runella slithyformis (strain ATCC 29530 / DSM 19594 / LMG 11500 / NCIMB 11436 / LSU 4) TaxID=761193 RepID=A0A7U4E6L0_RUNSL|nr:ATP-binding protein [Runella slithyformis]AEI49304.1 SMC domain protein [Runella slithyformis DSM 19594]
MFLKTIEVQNFRSISNLKVEDLGQINIFTGKNNCGKTTLLEAVFQLIAWQIGGLQQLNALRSLSKNHTDFSGFFYNMQEESTVIINGIFDQNSYHRTVKIHFTSTISSFNEESTQHLQSGLSESQKGENLSETIVSKAKIKDGEIAYDDIIQAPSVSLRCNFPIFKVFEHGNLVRSLSEIIKKKQDSKVVELLQQIDNRIRDIKVVENSIWLDLENFPKLIPIEISGDGLRRILSVILSIYGVGKGGIVMIDEVENGLHFSTMPKFWRGLINASQEIGIQLFITTHNEELLQSLSATAQENAYKAMQSNIKYYNLKRYVNDEIVAYKYDFEKFDFLISNGNEIR